MVSKNALTHQFSQLKLVFLLVLTVPLLVVITVLVISHVFQLPLPELLVDTVAVAKKNRFTGIASNVIILFWAATAAVIFFNILVSFYHTGKDLYFRFLVFFGLFTLLLLLDDLFLLHEGMSNFFTISEYTIFLTYMLVLIAGLIRFQRLILQTDYVLLLFSLACFGLAVIAGILQHEFQDYIGLYRVLLEAALKLFGAVSWFAYFCRVTFVKLQARAV